MKIARDNLRKTFKKNQCEKCCVSEDFCTKEAIEYCFAYSLWIEQLLINSKPNKILIEGDNINMEINEQKLEEVVKYNGNEITKTQLQEKVEETKNQPGAKIVEVKPGEFRKRLED